ncbi:MAG: hypothetical protein EXS12_06700 [Phycisphaerales bacterium]|nr:hypothetical protein [Phycisphaerales bacterium]
MGTPSVFAQCDPSSAGNFTDTEFNTAADGSSTGGVDDNGGWNEEAPYPYIEAGQKIIGDSFRVKGVVGTYVNPASTNVSRDMDWIRFSVPEGCAISATLSMSDRNGIAVNGSNLRSVLFIEQGSDPDTALDLYGGYGGCPHQAMAGGPGDTHPDQIPVAAGDVLIIVTTPVDNQSPIPLAHGGPMSYGLNVTIHSYAPCTGDLDGSGEVDAGDLSQILLSYGPCNWCEGEDLDFSGDVDAGDVGLMLLQMGPCQ